MTAIEKLIDRYNREADECELDAIQASDELVEQRLKLEALKRRQFACEVELAWRQDLCESLAANLPGFDPQLPIHEQTISGRN